MIRLAIALVLASVANASAETRRVAVVVGNNTGNGTQPPLRYAEVDAGKISRVLVELGGVTPSDLFLLQGKDLATLERTRETRELDIAIAMAFRFWELVVTHKRPFELAPEYAQQSAEPAVPSDPFTLDLPGFAGARRAPE